MKKYNAHTQLESIKQYFSLFFDRERKGWVKVIFFYNLYIPFILVVITGIAIYINPLPPKTAYLAIGQDGSSYQDIANSYKSFFKKNNINTKKTQAQLDLRFFNYLLFITRRDRQLLSNQWRYDLLCVEHRSRVFHFCEPTGHLAQQLFRYLLQRRFRRS